MTYQLKSTCDDAGNLLANGPRTISEHATREQAEAERRDWLRWYADRGVPIGEGCLSVDGEDRRIINRQALDSGKIRYEGWQQNGQRITGLGDNYNVSDYFGHDGEYLGPDEFGVEPIFTYPEIEESITEIVALVVAAGPAFSGGTDDSAREVAADWDDCFDGDVAAIEQWINAGYWSPAAASAARDEGHRPSDRPTRDGECMIYALCNDDVSVDDVDW